MASERTINKALDGLVTGKVGPKEYDLIREAIQEREPVLTPGQQFALATRLTYVSEAIAGPNDVNMLGSNQDLEEAVTALKETKVTDPEAPVVVFRGPVAPTSFRPGEVRSSTVEDEKVTVSVNEEAQSEGRVDPPQQGEEGQDQL